MRTGRRTPSRGAEWGMGMTLGWVSTRRSLSEQAPSLLSLWGRRRGCSLRTDRLPFHQPCPEPQGGSGLAVGAPGASCRASDSDLCSVIAGDGSLSRVSGSERVGSSLSFENNGKPITSPQTSCLPADEQTAHQKSRRVVPCKCSGSA